MMAAAAEQMKNIKPQDLDKMLEEMDQMNPLQAGALKAMGMDPEMMKKTVQMMKDNPQMVASAQKVMETMTPEQLMEQSRVAQQRMASMTPEQMEEANKAMGSVPKEQIDAAVDALKSKPLTSPIIDAQLADDDDDDDDDDVDDESSLATTMETGPGSSSDPAVIDTMFRVGELLSDPPNGGCSFAGFAALPVIQLLSGEREEDLSPSELKECWLDGSLGATKVDKEGFGRVWEEVQEYFEDDIMGEARKEAKKRTTIKKKRGATKKPQVSIGETMSSDQLKAVNEQMKSMSDDQVDSMLSQMENMGPAEEARMKAMGVDPAMMQRTAKMMKNNPMMREAAQKMMKNMTPEQMQEQAKMAQKQMANMSQADIEQAMKELEK